MGKQSVGFKVDPRKLSKLKRKQKNNEKKKRREHIFKNCDTISNPVTLAWLEYFEVEDRENKVEEICEAIWPKLFHCKGR